MSDAINIAVNGLNNAASKIAKAASSIVNASSIGSGGNLSNGLVQIAEQKTDYLADTKVIRVEQETNKALLDILA